MSLDAFKETKDPCAYLCHFCDAQIAKIVKYRAELQLTEEKVLEKVSHLTRLSQIGRSSETLDNTARRRPSTDGSGSRTKRPRSESIQMEEDEPLVTESVDHNEEENVEVAFSTSTLLSHHSNSTQPESNTSKRSSPSVTVSDKCICIIFLSFFFKGCS